jgi:hypothetical protein
VANVLFKPGASGTAATYAAVRDRLLGRVPDPDGAAAALLQALGVQLLSLIQRAFVEKARGGQGSDGITWAPLSKKYIAYGRRHPGLKAKRTKAAKAGRAGRPLLTAKQDARWKGIFASHYRRLQAKGVANAAGNAAALAWAIVKAEGGKTILGEYGSTKVEIGRNYGRLLNSLTPGAPGSVLDVGAAGQVSVGSALPYAAPFHSRRPLWPVDGTLPDAWSKSLSQTLADGIRDMVQRATS